MAVLKDLYPYVMPSVQGCPVSLVDNAIRSAVIDFCERTNMWKYSFPTTDVVGGQSSYTFTAPTNSVISKPTFVSVNSIPLIPTNEEDLDNTNPYWRSSSTLQPIAYYMDYNSTLTLVPSPTDSITSGLLMEAALKPTITTTTYPDWMFNNWAETLAHGALMRLHAMPGKVWADPSTVALHRAKFREGVSRAKSRTMKSFAKQGKSVQPRSFWE
jgi:hypothetical protein